MTTFGNEIWVGHARIPTLTLVDKGSLRPQPVNIDRLSVWALTATGSHVFAGGRTHDQAKDGVIVKINPGGRNEVARTRVDQLVQNIATDGEFVVTASDKNNIWVHSAADLRLLRTIRSTVPLTKPRDIIFRDGQLLLTNGGDVGAVYVFPDWKPRGGGATPPGTGGGGLPVAAGSWGGSVMVAPGKAAATQDTLSPQEPITILSKTAMTDDNYPWFQIQYRGNKTGYKWGGSLCWKVSPIAGVDTKC